VWVLGVFLGLGGFLVWVFYCIRGGLGFHCIMGVLLYLGGFLVLGGVLGFIVLWGFYCILGVCWGVSIVFWVVDGVCWGLLLYFGSLVGFGS
jgi:hypothetical protein